MNAPLRSKDMVSAPSLRQPVEAPASLIADITATLPELSLSEAQSVANIIQAYPNHWRQWRPESAWDRTYDNLLAYRAAVDVRAA